MIPTRSTFKTQNQIKNFEEEKMINYPDSFHFYHPGLLLLQES